MAECVHCLGQCQIAEHASIFAWKNIFIFIYNVVKEKNVKYPDNNIFLKN